jgi:hypothetical protein
MNTRRVRRHWKSPAHRGHLEPREVFDVAVYSVCLLWLALYLLH